MIKFTLLVSKKKGYILGDGSFENLNYKFSKKVILKKWVNFHSSTQEKIFLSMKKEFV